MKKQIGIIGLGKMGFNLSLSLLEKGWEVVGFNRTGSVTKKLKSQSSRPADDRPLGEKVKTKGIFLGAYSLGELTEKLERPRLVWLMVPHGAVDIVLTSLTALLEPEDILIDGGNSFYKDSIRRGRVLIKKGIYYIDVGVSGGPRGAREGACLMIGGNRSIYNKLEHLWKDISVKGGYGYFGKSGAGHFVKMAHNGIEYGMMQAIAEGFDILREYGRKTRRGEPLQNLGKVAKVYNHGSVIESRLIGWMEDGFNKYGRELEKVSGSAGASGEGEWTVKAAKELGVSAKVIEGALEARERSQKKPGYQGKIISVLRNMFGGHRVGTRNT